MKTDVDHVALECLKQQNGVLAAIALECVLQEHRLDWKCILFYSRKALIEKHSWPPEFRRQQMQVLRQLYAERGFTQMQLR